MLITQSAAKAGAIRNAISDLIVSDVERCVVCTAYMTKTASELLTGLLKTNVKRSVAEIEKRIITCFDYGITEPKALEYWLALPNTRVFVAGHSQLIKGVLAPSVSAFHPKIYAFLRPNSRANFLVGSANLTGRGFSANAEAAWAVKDGATADVKASISVLRGSIIALTPELLAQYASLYKKQPASRDMVSETMPVPEPSVQGELSWFWPALEARKVIPLHEQVLWVEAKKLSGGSHNQLELPRGAQRFFGFDFKGYGAHDGKVTIGVPTLRMGTKEWTDKILSWHGNNEMERINLPTVAQGGVAYDHHAIGFRRLSGNRGFELIVAPWNSDLARSWRKAALMRELLFRVGRNSDRQVGFT